MIKILDRTKDWKLSQGKNFYSRYLAGKRLTQRQAIVAKCAECCGGYADGKVDCRVPVCPLYPLMPYRSKPEGAALPVDPPETPPSEHRISRKPWVGPDRRDSPRGRPPARPPRPR
jgi:hypothetical protein